MNLFRRMLWTWQKTSGRISGLQTKVLLTEIDDIDDAGERNKKLNLLKKSINNVRDKLEKDFEKENPDLSDQDIMSL